MKCTVALLFICIVFSKTTYAQEDYSKALNGVEWVKIESKADIFITTHDKNELLIKVERSHKSSEKAKGLKLVGAGGTANTDVGFYVVEDGNNLIVKNLRKSDEATLYLPKTQNIAVKSSRHGDIKITGFSSEIEASAQLNGGIVIKDVTGPITADTLNGEVEIVFTKVNQTSPISIYTTNGELDITMPNSTPANITLGSVNGEIYTNFDLEVPNDNGLKPISTRKVKGTINKGGVAIELKSTNGNIYLRKN